MRRVFAPLLVFLLLTVVVYTPLQANAHTASAFTVLVKEDGFSQTAPEIFHNDSIIWYNTDNASNLTHRLVHDHDGDGLYNGSLDWDSGELHAYCERDENNTKIDASCNTSYVVEFNINWTEGDYAYQDLRSDGTVVNATIRLFKDMDSHNASTAPSIGSSFGVNEDASPDNTENDEAMTPEDMLLYVAMGTGGAAVLLLGLLVLRRPENADTSESE
ncbi:hypothetical protein N9L85_01880 [Euryarchaeota archaeon]|nr:hypothetical protein [Euryarchaeota archaeon]MDC3235702.1 hypothetical protein [Candidatus Poseidoniaceae archaeon]MDA8594101.1 hypothetical protein [Euryarchaeota archaeon]MDA8610554.1 hypothetical protein [Euryarchaeota archaeon]MDA8700317.1 hypothetical protein [Euryarchaeota archaeon]